MSQQPGQKPHTWVPFIKQNVADWICLIVLAILAGIANRMPPFHRFIEEHEMYNYMYPYHTYQTVPAWVLIIVTLIPALCVFVIFRQLNKINNTGLYRAIIGLIMSFLFTTVVTESLKNLVGRPRPHYFRRCFPDGNAPYAADSLLGYPNCDVIDAHRSFPSGHASGSMSGLGYLSFFLFDHLSAFNGLGSVWKGVLGLVPIFCSGLVGTTRVTDYYHHWGDVMFGLLLGLVVSAVSYYQYFPYRTTNENNNVNNNDNDVGEMSCNSENEERVRLVVSDI
eukprot:TRINITY_DN1919_c0_g1_i1.p1 TRINITY_DN1919_c0_g1~~TRINITY_DN1919_c0_g1_i1.p1  ORF type:complete len:308 (-),score=19.06 TRINITY_DN1919_c0_g1_i1:2603-3442(-)